MKPILFTIPLKQGKLNQYLAFAKESEQRSEEYRKMLLRYDIHSAKIWQSKIGPTDYVFVYHDVGPDFQEKMKGWETSEHPFDKWFRESINAVYDIESAATVAPPIAVLDFAC